MKPLIYFTIPLSYVFLIVEIILYVMPIAIYWSSFNTVNAIAYGIFVLILHVTTIAITSIFNRYLYKLWRYNETSSFSYTLFLLIVNNIVSLLCFAWFMQSLGVATWLLLLLLMGIVIMMICSGVLLMVTLRRITNQWMTPPAETAKEPIEVDVLSLEADEW